MKNSILKLMIFGFLSIGVKINAGAQDKPVDNSVKYGEKYSCVISTADEKTYLLDIVWSAEPEKFSTFPKWNENLSYVLTENSQQIDSNVFSDSGFAYSHTELTFNYDKYILVGNSSFATRVGTNSSTVNIEIKKSYDHQANIVLNVVAFKASHTFEKFYGGFKEKSVELAVVSSECSVSAADKD